jgi:hypothetical protein
VVRKRCKSLSFGRRHRRYGLLLQALQTCSYGARSCSRKKFVAGSPVTLFMDEFLALLESEPTRLGEFVAQPEAWRSAFYPLPTKRRRCLPVRSIVWVG